MVPGFQSYCHRGKPCQCSVPLTSVTAGKSTPRCTATVTRLSPVLCSIKGVVYVPTCRVPGHPFLIAVVPWSALVPQHSHEALRDKLKALAQLRVGPSCLSPLPDAMNEQRRSTAAPQRGSSQFIIIPTRDVFINFCCVLSIKTEPNCCCRCFSSLSRKYTTELARYQTDL